MFNSRNGKWYFVLGGLTVLALVAGVVVSAIPSASARTDRADTVGVPRSITVVGTGTASAAPDVATAQVGVDTQSASPEEATRQNDQQVKAVLDALKAAGIAEQDIQTAYYNMYAEQRYDPASGQATSEFTYRVSNSLSVKIRDLAKVGAVLSEAVKAGANNISGVSFSVEDSSALEAAAREEAVADAKARAESLAKLSGVALGEVSIVSEVIGGPAPVYYERAALGVGGGGGAPIQPGQLDVSVQIQMTFALN